MARERGMPFDLPSVDDLFTTQDERDDAAAEHVKDISLDLIDPFPEHPFQVRDDEEMQSLVTSVANFGVLAPILVRPKEDGHYELISGHRRCRAAEHAGLSTVPAVVRDMSRDDAIIAMVDSNLQREDILPSEKAFSYRMKSEALERRVGRPTKENGGPVGHNYRGVKSRDILAAESSDSARQIQRYIRLTYLIPELLSMVDDKKIAMRPAVELSYLKESEQQSIFEACMSEVCTPSHDQAIRLRKFSDGGRLSDDAVLAIMTEEKPNQNEQFRIPKAKISKYFKPNASRAYMEERIVKGLELLERQERRRENER